MSTTYEISPQTGVVSGTHTDIPVLITPSEITNIGTLTSAEADSVRIYSDSGLTTELAREIVNSDEIWTKVPSLSSSTTIYMVVDGTSSDYATTATYGRNAVWTDYDYVSHAGGGGTDSTGNGLTGTANGGVTSGGAATTKIGEATTYDGTDDYFSYGDVLDYNGHVNVYLSLWVRRNGTMNDFWAPISKQNGSGAVDQYEIRGSNNPTKYNPEMQVRTSTSYLSSSSTFLRGSTTLTDTTWFLLHGQADTVTDVLSLHMNASLADSQTHTGYSINNTASPFKLGAQTVSVNRFWKGEIDEVRVGQTIRSADWITTEYNNQNDNGAFWEATDVSGGGATFTPIVTMIT